MFLSPPLADSEPLQPEISDDHCGDIPPNTERPDVPVDVGFCDADDHLMIGIGGSRWGFALHDNCELDFAAEGLFAKFELWATEEEVLSLFGLVLGQSGPYSDETFLDLVSVGTGRDGLMDQLIEELRSDRIASQRLKDIVLKQLREFRTSQYVAEMTAHWRRMRTGK